MALTRVNTNSILDGSILNTDINASAAIDLSKLATGTLPSGLKINHNNIQTGIIENENISSSAAIAGSKINPTFTSDITINESHPSIFFNDSGDNPDYEIGNHDGAFVIQDDTNGVNRLVVNSDGHIDIAGNVDFGAGIDVTGNITATGQITASGNGITISGSSASLTLTDDGDDPDYRVQNNNGQFRIFDYTNSANRFSINSSGVVDIAGRLDANGGLDVTGNISCSGTVDGRDLATDGTKLDGIESNATADQTAAEILTLIKTVDGAGSGLDADTLDGINSANFLRSNTSDTMTGDLTLQGFSPDLNFVSTTNNPDWKVTNFEGSLILYDMTNSANKFLFRTDEFLSLEVIDARAGVEVTGNITVSGTVDGRDVATDGTKLDGIESNATADQTASEIVALVADQTIAPSEIDMEDGEKIKLGTSDDLLIYHQNNNSHILDNGTGDLRVTTNGAKIDFQKSGGEVLARFITDGSVELYEDGTKRFETTATGVSVTGNISVSGTVDGVDIATRDTLFGGLTSSSGVLANGVTATTQSAGDNSTKVATTAYTDTAISNLVDSSPSSLNTLNELAAALGDDANFSTTVTNSIATKLPLAGGTLSGDLTVNGVVVAGSTTNLPTLSSNGLVVASLSGNNNFVDLTILGGRTGRSMIKFGDHDSQNVGSVEYHHDTNSIQFFTNGSTTSRLVINSDGHVDVTGNLDVGAGLDVTGRIFGDTISLGGTGTSFDALFQFSNNTAYSASATNAKVAIGNANSSAATNSTGIHMFTDGNGRGVVNLNACNNSTNASADFVIQTRHNSTLSEKLRLTSDGNLRIPNDNTPLEIGASQDLQLYHSGSHSFIDRKAGGTGDIYVRLGTDNAIIAKTDGAVELFFDNNKKLATLTNGLEITGTFVPDGDGNRDLGSASLQWQNVYIDNDLFIGDSGKAIFGDSSDLSIFHDGSNTYLQNITGNLILKNNSTDYIIFKNSDASTEVVGNLDVGAGIDVTGNITATGEATISGQQLTVQGTSPRIRLIDTDQDSDFQVSVDAGSFKIEDITNSGADRLVIDSNGAVTLSGGISTNAKDVFTGGGTLIVNDADGAFADRSGSNIDHIWYQEDNSQANRGWNFCEDTTYKAVGNGQINVGRIRANNQPGVLVTNVVNETYTSSDNDDPIRFATTDTNNGGCTINSSRSRITVPIAGVYLLLGCISGTAKSPVNAGDGINLVFRKNGSSAHPRTDALPFQSFGDSNGEEWSFTANIVTNLAAGDYIEIALRNIGQSVEASIERGYLGVVMLH